MNMDRGQLGRGGWGKARTCDTCVVINGPNKDSYEFHETRQKNALTDGFYVRIFQISIWPGAQRLKLYL